MHPASPTLNSAFYHAWRDRSRVNTAALMGATRQIRYPQLFDEVSALSGRLHKAGIEQGDRVAIAMERSVDLAVTLLAVLATGASPCVLEPKLGRDEAVRRVTMTKMRWMLLDQAHAHDPILADLPGVQPLRLDHLPTAKPYWALDIESDAPGLMLFTSGSSGKPKGVLQCHRGMLVNTQGIIERTGLTPADRLLHVMPFFHTNGIHNQLLAPLSAGATVVIADRFKADLMPELMAQHRPTIITGVPTMYSRMLAVDFPADTLSSLRMMRCGSAPITAELHRQVETKFGLPLVISYGLSEATCTSTMNPPSQRKVGSVGPALSGQDVFLTDRNGIRVTEPHREGEICIGGPSLMLGYVEESSHGEPVPLGSVLHSGDLGRFDEDGYLYITGRLKDVIIRGGENLSPNLIESVLCNVPGVHACCVVGKPDADLGEVPWAFVVKMDSPSSEGLNETLMNAAVEASLSRIHKPAGYVYVDDLPENAVGKVDRKTLAARLRES